MTTSLNPIWWDATHDFAWDHVRAAMRRRVTAVRTDDFDFIPTKGLPNFSEYEHAYRFGYSARLAFEMDHSDRAFYQIDLAKEWLKLYPMRQEKWKQDCIAILVGWNYEAAESQSSSSHVEEKLLAGWHHVSGVTVRLPVSFLNAVRGQ